MSQAPEVIQKVENLDCIHCGLCLSACPTYTREFREADSPRGRIYLINSVREGKIEFDRTVQQHLDLCLGCRACESACPSGVQFESLLTGARARMEQAMPRSRSTQMLRRLGFRHLLPFPGRLHLLFGLVRWMKKLGVHRLGRMFPPASIAARSLAQLDSLPVIPPGVRILEGRFPALSQSRQQVAFFRGCVMNEIYFPAQIATVNVLRAAGCDVEVISGQTCCGALHDHNGERLSARDLAWRNIQAFRSSGDIPIITNSAGCGALLKHYEHLFEPADSRRAAAVAFSSRVRDLSEFLAGLDRALAFRPLRARVTYDDPCHLIHGQKISQQPRTLLGQIPGIEYVELNQASWCCGGAGTYSMAQPAMSELVLQDKISSIVATGAGILVTANPGCMLQIGAGLRRAGHRIEVLHLAEILERALL
ncbi:MAG TPA: (Fe-S)-binding protein [Acidobacteriota bacterium]